MSLDKPQARRLELTRRRFDAAVDAATERGDAAEAVRLAAGRREAEKVIRDGGPCEARACIDRANAEFVAALRRQLADKGVPTGPQYSVQGSFDLADIDAVDKES